MAGPVTSALRDAHSDLRKLRWLLAGVLLALLVPTAILATRAYNQLGFESLHRYRLTSENIAANIDAGLQRLLASESAHPVEHYAFYLVPPAGGAKPVLSPLAQLGTPQLPGVLGHFVISDSGALRTPLLPVNQSLPDLLRSELLSAQDIAQRQRQQQQMSGLLGGLAQSDVSEAPSLSLDDANEAAPSPKPEAELARELSSAPAPDRSANRQLFERLSGAAEQRKKAAPAPSSDDSVASSLSLNQDYLRRQRAAKDVPAVAFQQQLESDPETLESDFEWFVRSDGAMEYLPVGADHLLLYRRSWQSGAALVLGVVVERNALFAALLDTPFLSAQDNDDLMLTLTDNGRPVRRLLADADTSATNSRSYASNVTPGGELLYRSRLPAPFSDMQLVFSAAQVGMPPGGGWIVGSSVLLILLLLGGFALMYRLGVHELERRATQQNFVSAVSHELKTPLTAIRMYGEMLRSGWVSEDKKPGYYDFIFSESERLSRLISNVLRLSQISRDRLALTPAPHSAADLVDVARSKLQSLSESAALEYELPPTLAEARVLVDPDAIAQILINLVDNAIKFSASEGVPRVIIELQGLPSNLPADRRELRLSVRDFGPGIPKAQLSRIFDLFYRGEDELTRQTQGTGIGLALVAELAAGMQGRIEVANSDPGARFSVCLPIVE